MFVLKEMNQHELKKTLFSFGKSLVLSISKDSSYYEQNLRKIMTWIIINIVKVT